MDILDQISIADLWQWALANIDPMWIAPFAALMVFGVVWRFIKEPIHFIVELIARFGNFLWYVITHAFSARVRERERREMRKQQHEPIER